jgi:hypothetical protein
MTVQRSWMSYDILYDTPTGGSVIPDTFAGVSRSPARQLQVGRSYRCCDRYSEYLPQNPQRTWPGPGQEPKHVSPPSCPLASLGGKIIPYPPEEMVVLITSRRGISYFTRR